MVLWLSIIFTFSLLDAGSKNAEAKPKNSPNSDTPNCINPNREYGFCFELINCKSLLSILKQKPINPRSLRFLQRSTCGFKMNMPKVCCVDEDDIEAWKASKEPSLLPDPDQTSPATTASTVNPTMAPTTEKPTSEPLEASLKVAFSMKKPLRERLLHHPSFHLLPTTETCGVSLSTDRIIGGRLAELGEFPWMVLIAFGNGKGSEPQFACGGTLISERYVLTASHCVVNLPFGYKVSFARIGEFNQSQPVDCLDDLCADPVQDIEVEEIISHPKYDLNHKKENDIALLRLKTPAKFGIFVSPICLPFELDLKKSCRTSEQITKLSVAGWGRTIFDQPEGSPVLQWVQLPLISTEECNSYYMNKVHLGGIDDTRFCAGGDEGMDSCRGDSGGPLMEAIPIQDDKIPNMPVIRTFQFGVVSLGPSKCGSRDQPGLYTKISHYLLWILNNIRS